MDRNDSKFGTQKNTLHIAAAGVRSIVIPFDSDSKVDMIVKKEVHIAIDGLTSEGAPARASLVALEMDTAEVSQGSTSKGKTKPC